MLRGTLVFFAGLLTIVILKRRLYLHNWMVRWKRGWGWGHCCSVAPAATTYSRVVFVRQAVSLAFCPQTKPNAWAT